MPDTMYLTRTVGGKELRLRKPTYRDLVQLRESAHRWRKERFADNLQCAGIEGKAMLAELTEFDRTDLPSIADYINSGHGQIEAAGMAVENEADLEALLAAPDLMDIVAALWGLTLEPLPEASQQNPTQPPQ
jgi:hypothetical protein